MQIFMIVVALHFSEHLVQIWQLWVLGWPRPQCMGLLGLAYPWLMRSEWLHYGHALFMLIGFAVFRPSMVGKALIWCNRPIAYKKIKGLGFETAGS
jgi:hypothetical protein